MFPSSLEPWYLCRSFTGLGSLIKWLKREQTRTEETGTVYTLCTTLGPATSWCLLNCHPGQGLGSPYTAAAAAGQRESTHPSFWQDVLREKILFPNKYKLERFLSIHIVFWELGKALRADQGHGPLSCNKRTVVWGNASHPFTTWNFQHGVSLPLSKSHRKGIIPYPPDSVQGPQVILQGEELFLMWQLCLEEPWVFPQRCHH